MPSIPVSFTVSDIDNVLKYFDTVEVQKSVAGTPYADAEAVSALQAAGATLTGTGSVFTSLAGTTLKLDIAGTAYEHTFVGPNPMTIRSILRELREIPGVEATSSSGRLKLTTEALGAEARLTIMDGTANDILGFEEDQFDYGIDQNVDLLSGVSKYTFLDRIYPYENGWYRIRFVNNSTGAVDAWQEWFLGPGAVAVDPASLITGTIKLSNLVGGTLEDVEVTIVNCFSPLIVDTYFVAGASVTVKTDSSGIASVSLVRGALVDVVIEGTSIIRRVQVPTQGDSFDLLDPQLQVDDTFGIQEPDLPAAVRHS